MSAAGVDDPFGSPGPGGAGGETVVLMRTFTTPPNPLRNDRELLSEFPCLAPPWHAGGWERPP